MTDQGHNTTPRSASPLGNGLGVHPELHLGNTDGRGGGTARGAANGSSPPPPVPSSSDKIVPPSAMVESSPFSSSTSEKRTILEPSSVNAEVSGRQNQTSSQGSTEPNSPDGALKENGNRDNQGNHGIKYMGATSNNDSASCASDYIVSGSNKMPKWATRYLAPWFIHHLKNPRTWKTFVRIMVVLLANLILMVDNKSLESMGQAGFFCLIVAVMIPPMMPTSLFLMSIVTLLLGMLLGWAWGCAAIAASLKARNAAVTMASIAKANSQAVNGVSLEAQLELSVFKGEFLEPGPTAVVGVFFFIGAYFFGAMRAKYPNLLLFTIFGTIVLDTLCMYGPMIPLPSYMLASLFFVPTGYYVAIATVSTLLIFPESLNHSITEKYIAGFLRPGLSLIQLQSKILTMPMTDVETWSKQTKYGQDLRQGYSQVLNLLLGQVGPMGLEISRGRFNAIQMETLLEKSKMLGGRMSGLSSFQVVIDKLLKTSGDHTPRLNLPRITRYRKLALEQEEAKGTGLATLLPLLQQSSAGLREATEEGTITLIEVLEFTNKHRWSKSMYRGSSVAEIDHIQQVTAKIKHELAAFRASHYKHLLEPFKELFDDDTVMSSGGLTSHCLTSRSLFLCFVYCTNLIAFSYGLIDYLETLTGFLGSTPGNKFHPPTAILKIGKILTTKTGTSTNPLEIGTQTGDYEDKAAQEDDTGESSPIGGTKAVNDDAGRRRFRPDPDAKPPRSLTQRSIRHVSRFWKWQISAEGLFALKYGIVSIALWMPAIFPNSAYFSYSNRALWALIMAQVGLGVYAGEQILAFFVRIVGTVTGALLGAVAWYIGSGKGKGNPYGIVVITLVMLAPFIFIRLSGPAHHRPIVLMISVTICFVVGYSWVDNHIPMIVNAGEGIGIAWKRGLLVTIGLAAAFITSLFPKPQTSKMVVRKTMARTIERLGDLYSEEMKGFFVESKKQQGVAGFESTAKYRGDFLKIVGKLEMIEGQMMNASVEPGLRGTWPKKEYQKLLALQHHALGAMSLLAGAWSQMKPSWMRAMIDRTSYFEPVFIADVLSMFNSLSNSLHRGLPLPTTVPLRERFAIYSLNKQREVEGRGADGLTLNDLGFHPQFKDIQDEQLAVYATAFCALTVLVGLLDEMHEVIKDLTGEKQFKDLQDWDRMRAERDARGLQVV